MSLEPLPLSLSPLLSLAPSPAHIMGKCVVRAYDVDKFRFSLPSCLQPTQPPSTIMRGKRADRGQTGDSPPSRPQNGTPLDLQQRDDGQSLTPSLAGKSLYFSTCQFPPTSQPAPSMLDTPTGGHDKSAAMMRKGGLGESQNEKMSVWLSGRISAEEDESDTPLTCTWDGRGIEC